MTDTDKSSTSETTPTETGPRDVQDVDGSEPVTALTSSESSAASDATENDPGGDAEPMTLRELLDQCRKFHLMVGLTIGWFGAVLLRSLWVGDALMVLITGFAVGFGVWVTVRQARAYRDSGWL